MSGIDVRLDGSLRKERDREVKNSGAKRIETSSDSDGQSVTYAFAKSWEEFASDMESWKRFLAAWERPGLNLFVFPKMQSTTNEIMEISCPSQGILADGFVQACGNNLSEVKGPDGKLIIFIDHHAGSRFAVDSCTGQWLEGGNERLLKQLRTKRDRDRCNILVRNFDEDVAGLCAGIREDFIRMQFERIHGVSAGRDSRLLARRRRLQPVFHAINLLDKYMGGPPPEAIDDEAVQYVNFALHELRRKPPTSARDADHVLYWCGRRLDQLATQTIAVDLLPTLQERYHCVARGRRCGIIESEEPDARRKMRRDGLDLVLIQKFSGAGKNVYSLLDWTQQFPYGDFHAMMNRAEVIRAEAPSLSSGELASMAESSTTHSDVPRLWSGNEAGGNWPGGVLSLEDASTVFQRFLLKRGLESEFSREPSPENVALDVRHMANSLLQTGSDHSN